MAWDSLTFALPRFLSLHDACAGSCGTVQLSEDCYVSITAYGLELAK